VGEERRDGGEGKDCSRLLAAGSNGAGVDSSRLGLINRRRRSSSRWRRRRLSLRNRHHNRVAPSMRAATAMHPIDPSAPRPMRHGLAVIGVVVAQQVVVICISSSSSTTASSSSTALLLLVLPAATWPSGLLGGPKAGWQRPVRDVKGPLPLVSRRGLLGFAGCHGCLLLQLQLLRLPAHHGWLIAVLQRWHVHSRGRAPHRGLGYSRGLQARDGAGRAALAGGESQGAAGKGWRGGLVGWGDGVGGLG